ncbi:hypothetical protein NDU88_004512 [Pleurodeles waltl]|uniref:Uncharacterized protein n=1 Tax=Pleurodeles waltl TaxID=8319 RepID=A0AAV7NK02_PLEWA|nr:hypothetical protein NDU88_004512 [Pleurodeles waltl]
MHREALLVSRSPPTLFLFKLLLVESPGVSGKLPRREQREGALSTSTPREKKKKNAINSSSRQEERLTRGAGLGALHNPSLSPSLFPGVSPPNLFLVTTRGPLYGRGDPLARRSNCGTAPALSASFPGQGSQVASLVRVSRPMGVRGQRFNRPPCSPSLLLRVIPRQCIVG